VIPIAILPAAYGAIKPTIVSDAELQPPALSPMSQKGGDAYLRLAIE
jgi:hypothetical protein